MSIGICINSECKKEYEKYDSRQKYCSSSCFAIINNKIRKRKNKKIKICKYCKNNIISKNIRKVCDYCLKNGTHIESIWKDKKIKILDLSVVEIKQKYKGVKWTDVIRNHARRTYNTLGKSCKCGYNKHVEICHIKAISSFDDSATLKEINDINNILFLCPNCHWELDNLLH